MGEGWLVGLGAVVWSTRTQNGSRSLAKVFWGPPHRGRGSGDNMYFASFDTLVESLIWQVSRL